MPQIVLATIVAIADNKSLGKTQKKAPFCPKCKSELDTRIRRGLLVKTFLFWLPIKRYVCYKCHKKTYKLS